jgi:hypothetical protein
MSDVRAARMLRKGIDIEHQESTNRSSPRPRYKHEKHVPALPSSAQGSTDSPTTTPSNKSLKPTGSPVPAPAKPKGVPARPTGRDGTNSSRSAAPHPSTPARAEAAAARPAGNQGKNSASSPTPRPSGPRPSTPVKPKAATAPGPPAKPPSGSRSAHQSREDVRGELRGCHPERYRYPYWARVLNRGPTKASCCHSILATAIGYLKAKHLVIMEPLKWKIVPGSCGQAAITQCWLRLHRG